MNHYALAAELADRLAQYVPEDDAFLQFVRRALQLPSEGNFKRGEGNPSNVLTPANVREMRNQRSAGMSCSELATIYGISKKHVWRICTREQWSWVE